MFIYYGERALAFSTSGAEMALLARDVQRTLDAVWRMESGRLIGRIARIVGDLGLAEDLAQEALVDALERWPSSGIPDNPAAWLMTAGKHRAIAGSAATSGSGASSRSSAPIPPWGRRPRKPSRPRRWKTRSATTC